MATALQILYLVTQLMPAVSDLVKQLEKIFGPGTGATKKELAKATLLEALAADPDAAFLSSDQKDKLADALVERQVKAAKATGLLPAPSQQPA